MTSVVVTTDPAIEPVTLTEAKAHLVVEHNLDDTLITTLITTAREYVETYTRRSLITRELTAKYDFFPPWFEILNSPLLSITSINYLDTDGNNTLLASSNYDEDTNSTPARVTQAHGATWPSTRTGVPNVVTIVYQAGYGPAASDVPNPIKHAILMYISHLYENRETASVGVVVTNIPRTIDALILPYRVY